MSTQDEEQQSPALLWETQVGWVEGTDGEERPVVNFPGNSLGPRVAQRTVPLTGEALQAAIAARQPVQLRFEEGNPRRPVIIGLLAEAEKQAEGLRRSPEEAGRDIQLLEGKDGLVLKCGKASLTLLRNGKILLKGTYIETHSEGVNRIKGGVVSIG